VIFETTFFLEDKFKIKLCKICSKIGVAFVRTSTGLWFFCEGADGKFSPKGRQEHGSSTHAEFSDPKSLQLKAAAVVRTLDGLLLGARDLGCTRLGALQPKAYYGRS